jgi:toxin secretion/phage lysis holin
MDKIFATVIAVVGALVNFAFGEWSQMLQTLLLFVVVDYLSGCAASSFEGKLSSKKGFIGIAKKVMIFVIVAVTHKIDMTLGQNHFFRDATIFFYLSNELLSIIENAGRLKLPVPEVVTRAVDVLRRGGKQ